MYYKEKVSADNAGISRITQAVREQLERYSVKPKELDKAVLASEEAARSIAFHADENSEIEVSIMGILGSVRIEFSSRGEEYKLADFMKTERVPDDAVSEAAQEMISGVLLKAMSEGVKYHHRKGCNRISVTVLRSKRAFLYQTLGAMLIAIIVGFILTELGFKDFNGLFDKEVLVPIKNMYMNGLKMVVAPVVFFSIVSCIVQFTDLSELGRVGGRVISMYMLTTVIAVGVGIGVYTIFQPGSAIPPSTAQDAVNSITSQTMDVSIKDMIIGIIPSDFLQPFLESNMLQLIFLAIICGIAAGKIGRYSDNLRQTFEMFNDLFLKITTMFIRFMPVAVFCSICSMMLNMGISTIISVMGMFGTFMVGLVCMLIVYSLILLIVGGLNPIYLWKSYVPSMAQVFSMGSSNPSIPINMEACEKMGIEKKIYSLSIPLGATLNMDGTCVHLAVFALALAKTYGVPVTGASMTAMVVSIIVLSIGAPGIPGSGLICLSVLLTQIGVPTEAIGLVMGIDALGGMFRAMNNCTGDVAMSLLVANKEKALDLNKYYNR